MGKTSSTVKDRYNRKVYDALTLRLPKGQKEAVQAAADAAGESLNAYISESIARRMEQDAQTNRAGTREQ